MTEPPIFTGPPVVQDMPPAPEPWITAVAAVLRPFVTYAQQRQITADLEQCRAEARVSAATAELFEDALDDLFDDEEDDTTEDEEAAPDATEAASDPSERNRHA
jgi:hypothetical protein